MGADTGLCVMKIIYFITKTDGTPGISVTGRSSDNDILRSLLQPFCAKIICYQNSWWQLNTLWETSRDERVSCEGPDMWQANSFIPCEIQFHTNHFNIVRSERCIWQARISSAKNSCLAQDGCLFYKYCRVTHFCIFASFSLMDWGSKNYFFFLDWDFFAPIITSLRNSSAAS